MVSIISYCKQALTVIISDIEYMIIELLEIRKRMKALTNVFTNASLGC